jgi:uncharacterized protein involved in tolerance to divalent cations
VTGNKIQENYHNEFSLYNTDVVIKVLKHTNAEKIQETVKLCAVLMNSSIISLLHCMLNKLSSYYYWHKNVKQRIVREDRIQSG